MPKRFTLEEANHLIPTLQPLMEQLLEHQAHLATLYQPIRPLLNQATLNVGNTDTTKITIEMLAIERLLANIRSYGCVVKDIKVGLIDFLSEQNGRTVYLCWRFGEPEITHQHDLEGGFSNRRLI
jgi:hypothetical protein